MSKKTNNNFNEWLENYYQRTAYGNYFDAVGVYTRKELYKEFVKEINKDNMKDLWFDLWLKENNWFSNRYGNYDNGKGFITDRDSLYQHYLKETEIKKENKLHDNTVPSHYQTDKDFDVIDFCHLYNLNFARGSAIKYIARAGKKDNEIEDLKKAIDFLERELKKLKEYENE